MNTSDEEDSEDIYLCTVCKIKLPREAATCLSDECKIVHSEKISKLDQALANGMTIRDLIKFVDNDFEVK